MTNSRKILHPKETWKKLGCGHSKFEEHYRFHSAADPFVPNTRIPRVKAVPLGERNIGFLEHELDELINALAKLRDAKNVKAARTSLERETPAANKSGQLARERQN